MSIEEAAIFLNVSQRMIWDSISAKRISHIRFGGRTLLRLQDLQADLAKWLVPATAET